MDMEFHIHIHMEEANYPYMDIWIHFWKKDVPALGSPEALITSCELLTTLNTCVGPHKHHQ
jgi:hypothetical protein